MLKYIQTLFLLFIFLASFAQNKSFTIINSGTTATIIYDPHGPALDSIAAHLLANDIELVAGVRPQVRTDISHAKGNLIIIGSIHSNLIKKLPEARQTIKNLEGKWETYALKIIDKPSSDIEKVLLVAGSDKRGTAYGVFDISAKIGVSPWYWWADVHPQKKREIVIEQSDSISNSPSVKYRGIFLNDEDWGLQPWAAKTFEPEVGDIGAKTYSRIFELLLRLKANLIWPAMHPCTKPFFSYPANVKTAEDFGIVVGTSHAEPMLRNNVGEWDEKTMGHFNYFSNKQAVYNYWTKRAAESKGLETIYTMGMRGVHDSGMEGVKNADQAVKALEEVIADQRGILKKEVSSDITTLPQAFTAYKEVLEVYDHGLKLPEDITIVWPDDNYGYIQRLNNKEEQKRQGGSGVYYHASYWGRPHDYLWLSSTHPSLIWEEMHKAYSLNAKNIWVVNVGDIKPIEFQMDLFLSMAYNMAVFQDIQSCRGYTQKWFENKFGSSNGKAITEVFEKYYHLAFERRPEFMGWSQTEPTTPARYTEYNHFYYGDEAQKRMDSYDSIEKRVKELKQKIPVSQSDAFYELVYYPVVSASLINKKFLYHDKNYWYGKQNRLSSKDYADLSIQAYDEIVKETEYFNHELARGKWKHMMSMEPRKLPVFSKPLETKRPEGTREVFGIVPEGFVTADSSLSGPHSGELFLPSFTPAGSKVYFIDLYLQKAESLSWSASIDNNWISLSQETGNLRPEFGKNQVRLWVSIDWEKFPGKKDASGRITFTANGKRILVKVSATNNAIDDSATTVYWESNGYVSIWASNYSHKTGGEKGWKELDGLGYSGKCVYTPYIQPVNIDTNQIVKESPSLSYDFYSTSEVAPTLSIYSLPTHPVNNTFSQRYAVSIDDGPIQIVDFRTFGRSEEWKQNVLRNTAHKQIKVPYLKRGKHTLKIFLIDPGVFLDRITIDFGGLKNAYGLIPETKTSR